MPLSKKRDSARKRLERAKSRLDRLLCPPSDSEGVQPNVEMARRMLPIQMRAYALANKPELDADGNPIYEEE